MIWHQTENSLSDYNYNAFIYDNFQFGSHFHGNFELLYVYDGIANISVNGIPEVLNPGEMLLIPPYTAHMLDVKDSKVWIGVFSEDFISSYVRDHKYTRYSKFKASADIEEILKKYLFFEGQPDHFLLISCLYMVCNECIKNAKPLNTESDYKFIYTVISHISDNLSWDISLKDIADKMNYDYHYFSSLFHQNFSMNFKSFVNLFRFEKACALLKNKGTSITYVAEVCGFGSIRNFNRVFKTLSGYTPREYKNKQENKA